jgi:magnesium-protoporphyrin O-methyltransferase
MREIRDYFDRMATAFDDYYRQPKHNLLARLGHVVFRKPGLVRRFQATIDLLGDVSGQRILDAGCGPGAYAVYLWRHGARVTGIDVSERMIEAARANAEAAGWHDAEADLRVGDVSELAAGEPYDAVIAIGVFDYLGPDVRGPFLAHLAALTRGPVVATFPKRFTPQMPVRRLYFVGKECPVYFYTSKAIRELARGAGREAQLVDCGPIWTIAFRPPG